VKRFLLSLNVGLAAGVCFSLSLAGFSQQASAQSFGDAHSRGQIGSQEGLGFGPESNQQGNGALVLENDDNNDRVEPQSPSFYQECTRYGHEELIPTARTTYNSQTGQVTARWDRDASSFAIFNIRAFLDGREIESLKAEFDDNSYPVLSRRFTQAEYSRLVVYFSGTIRKLQEGRAVESPPCRELILTRMAPDLGSPEPVVTPTSYDEDVCRSHQRTTLANSFMASYNRAWGGVELQFKASAFYRYTIFQKISGNDIVLAEFLKIGSGGPRVRGAVKYHFIPTDFDQVKYFVAMEEARFALYGPELFSIRPYWDHSHCENPDMHTASLASGSNEVEEPVSSETEESPVMMGEIMGDLSSTNDEEENAEEYNNVEAFNALEDGDEIKYDGWHWIKEGRGVCRLLKEDEGDNPVEIDLKYLHNAGLLDYSNYCHLETPSLPLNQTSAKVIVSALTVSSPELTPARPVLEQQVLNSGNFNSLEVGTELKYDGWHWIKEGRGVCRLHEEDEGDNPVRMDLKHLHEAGLLDYKYYCGDSAADSIASQSEPSSNSSDELTPGETFDRLRDGTVLKYDGFQWIKVGDKVCRLGREDRIEDPLEMDLQFLHQAGGLDYDKDAC